MHLVPRSFVLLENLLSAVKFKQISGSFMLANTSNSHHSDEKCKNRSRVLNTHQSVSDSQTQQQEARMKFTVFLLIVAAFCAVVMARPSLETDSVESNESDLQRVRRDLSSETNSVESNESDLQRVRRDLSPETDSVESKSDERN
jgi:hypothetical protein